MIGNGNIRLTYICEEVSHELNKYRNDENVRRWCRQHSLINDEQQADWYLWQARDPNTRMFEIVARDQNTSPFKVVGICGLTSIDWVHRRAEFSCYVFPDHRLNGYCKEALILLFNYGFRELNLHSIWGETFQDNPAYHLFVDVLGMTPEGTRREFYYKNGKYIDCHLLSILRSEWERNV